MAKEEKPATESPKQPIKPVFIVNNEISIRGSKDTSIKGIASDQGNNQTQQGGGTEKD